jgi:hypothetical protein
MDWFICGCPHLLNDQRFSREILGSFISGTDGLKRIEENLKSQF